MKIYFLAIPIIVGIFIGVGIVSNLDKDSSNSSVLTKENLIKGSIIMGNPNAKITIAALALVFVFGLFVVGFDQGHIFSVVMGEQAFDEMFIHELTHDMRHAAGFPCH